MTSRSVGIGAAILGCLLAVLSLAGCGSSSKTASIGEVSSSSSASSSANVSTSTTATGKSTKRPPAPSAVPKAASPTPGGRVPTPAPRRNPLQPAVAAALEKFAACIRENGVNLPPPDTTGGRIFDTSHLDTSSPQFKAAETKYNGVLKGAA
jgi:hypothetical protein